MKNWSRFWADNTLIALLILCVLIPFAASLIRWLFDFDTIVLNQSFWTLIFKSISFTFIQATLSATLSVGAGLCVGIGLSLIHGQTGKLLLRISSAVGNFCFVLPGLSVALIFMNLSKSFSFWPTHGLFAIVLAHFVLNVLFLSAQIAGRIQDWEQGTGLELQAAAQTLGAQSPKAFFLTVSPLLLTEIRTWFPLVFLWSFTAFSTVLMMGGSPKFSTPEVLLYYFLQNDFNSARILVLCLVQLLMAALLLKFSNFSLSATPVELMTTLDNQLNSQNQIFLLRKKIFTIFKAGALFFCGIFLCLLTWSLLNGLSVIFQKAHLSAELRWAMGHSLLLALFTGLACLLLSIGLFLCSNQTRSFLFVCGAMITPTLLVAAYLSAELDRQLLGTAPVLQILFCSLAIALTLLPLMSLWIKRRLEGFSKEWEMAAATLGASGLQRFFWVYWPLNRDLLLRIFRLGFLTGLGEVALCTLLIQDIDFAAGLTKQLANRYDFEASRWLLLFIVLTTLLISLVSKERKKYGNPSV